MGIAGAGNSGTAFATFFAPMIAAQIGWHAVFGLAIIPISLTLLVFFLLAKDSPRQPQPKRWAEYLTFVATCVFIPYELYELSKTVSVFKVGALIVNLAVAAYLLWAKRLFGLRGGGAADEEARARDIGWDALERTAPEP